jgi:thiol-disulfide isomerase/thioredoxin
MKKKYVKSMLAGALLATMMFSLSGCGEMVDAFAEGFEEGFDEAMEENTDSGDDIEVVTPEEAGLVVNNGADNGQGSAVQSSSSLEDWGLTSDDLNFGNNGGGDAESVEDGSSDEGSDGGSSVAGNPTGEFVFTSKDINGNDFNFADYSDYPVIMVNFWEPWCGPCVGEMPDLNELYTTYKDDGFLVIGVYSDYDSDAKDVIKETGVTYPVIKYVSGFDKYQTGYVPTTIFVNGNGDVLSDEPYVGSMSKSEWEEIIFEYIENAY